MKLLGKYKAVAGKTEYTNEQILTQVKLVTLWDNIPEESLPWAEYQMPIGAVFVPAKVGDLVWVEFPQEGDSRYPLITGACMVSPKGMPNIPAEASGKGTPYQQAKVDGAPALSAVTPMADIVGRRNGLLEQRSEKGGIMFTHEKSGTRLGFNDEGELFFYAAKNMHFFSGGTIIMEAKGDYTHKAANHTIKTSAKYSVTSSSTYSVSAPSIAFKKG